MQYFLNTKGVRGIFSRTRRFENILRKKNYAVPCEDSHGTYKTKKKKRKTTIIDLIMSIVDEFGQFCQWPF